VAVSLVVVVVVVVVIVVVDRVSVAPACEVWV